jgi:hypothetical protein
VVIAWDGGLWIRFNFDLPDRYSQTLWLGLGALLVVHANACRWAGLYRGMWVFASLPDLKRALRTGRSRAAFLGRRRPDAGGAVHTFNVNGLKSVLSSK